MPLFKKVIYSTDFSPLAGYALQFVKKLKNAGMESVIVVHVVNELSVTLPNGLDLRENKTTVEALESADREYLYSVFERAEAIKEKIEELGVDVVLKVITGSNTAETIVDMAEAERIDVIVIGAHGKGFLKELILGSVSLDVVRKAKCPVLLIKKTD